MSKRRLNRRQNWRIQKIQDERADRAARREQKSLEQLNASDLESESEGLVIAHYGVQLDVEPIDEPGNTYRCNMRANLPALVTGDRVVWRAGKDKTGVVVAHLPRTSELARPDSQGQLKPVAANINYIVLVIAPIPEPYGNLIDRYLVAAESVGIEPVILLNKTDLLNAANEIAIKEDLLKIYRDIGYQVLEASTVIDHGLDTLRTLLNDHASVFVGQSGVGKSSLINCLMPGISIKVGELSANTGKGTHTTTVARLFHMPDGGILVDSPGIREFGLWHMNADDVIHGFRELHPFIGHCRFRDCRHEQEPGCAIHAALKDGHITPRRMASWRHIVKSLQDGI